MIVKLPLPVQVPIEQERGFRLRRHLLVDGSGSHSPEWVAERMVGLHAARLSSPWVAMRARTATFQPEHLRRPLVDDGRSLLKLRCMRRTLHILPLHLAPVAHLATLEQRAGTCRASLRRLGRSERLLRSTAEHVKEHLAGRTEHYRALEGAVLRARPREADLIRLAIKWLWEHGEIVYLDLSPSLHHEQRAFALTAEAIPELQLDATSVDTARQELVIAHIRAFGPVSVRDIAWWSGMGTGQVFHALNSRHEELATVNVPGLARNLVLHVEDLPALREADAVPSDQLSLLGHEDPALKGYFETRSRYVSPAHYNILFNTIGEARASIMYRGRIVGVWTWNRRKQAVESHTFKPLPVRAQRRLAKRLGDMEAFLGAEVPAP